MEPILLQDLLNKSSRKRLFQEPHSGPLLPRLGLLFRHEQSEQLAENCL